VDHESPTKRRDKKKEGESEGNEKREKEMF